MTIFIEKKAFLLGRLKNRTSVSKRSWARDIKNLYRRTCIVTRLTEDNVNLESHHLNSISIAPHLEFSLLNGLPMADFVHKDFHSLFGPNVTSECFIQYLNIVRRDGTPEEQLYLDCVCDWIKQLEYEMSVYNL
jgi:hypothetical protein